ncbi:MAG: aconitase/3-isopropylmalate dehydratase large subunit family protein [Thermoleophilia bacterium]|nr:aconitase/3-isopropylmalate dehydratase large subunit family protein [Thermoleophilia bacterium]
MSRGLTISQKILARGSDRDRVEPGEVVEARIDLGVILDKVGPHVVNAFRGLGARKIWDSSRILINHDMIPASTVRMAENQRMLNAFGEEQDIDCGMFGEGIYHDVVVDKGYVRPGYVIIVTDSHAVTLGGYGAFATGVGISDMAMAMAKGSLWFKVPATLRYEISGTLPGRVAAKDLMLQLLGQGTAAKATYRAVEYGGPSVESMSVDSRLVLANLSVEQGAKVGIVEPNEATMAFLSERLAGERPESVTSDPNAEFAELIRMDASRVEPLIAKPHSPDNVVAVSEVAGTRVDQVFLGTCNGGRGEDLRAAARILEGRRVARGTRLIVIPTSARVARETEADGTMQVLREAGAICCNANCGPCFGQHQGTLAPGEVCLSTGNRNFQGRMGSNQAFVYLGSPYTAAATALNGEITDPREV